MLALLGQALPVVLVGVLLLNLLQRGLTRPGGTGDPHPPSAPRPRTPAGSAQRPPTTTPRPTPRSPAGTASPTGTAHAPSQPAPSSTPVAPTESRAPAHPAAPPTGTPAPCSPVVPAPGQWTTAPPEPAVLSAVGPLHAARRVAILIAAGVVLALWCAVLLLQQFLAPDWTAILLLPAAGGAVYVLRARFGVFPLHCRRCGRRLPLGVTLGFDATATARYEAAGCPHPACGVQAPPAASL